MSGRGRHSTDTQPIPLPNEPGLLPGQHWPTEPGQPAPRWRDRSELSDDELSRVLRGIRDL